MSFELFLRNVKYLFKYNLKHIYQHASSEHDDELIAKILEMKQNEEYLKSGCARPHILTAIDTVKLLAREKLSFCRFGDGELSLLGEKKSGVFQKYDEKLSGLLQEALSEPDPKLLVGIFYYFYNEPQNLHERQQVMFWTQSPKYRQILDKYLDYSVTYGDALVSMPYHLYENYDYAGFYQAASALWAGKNIVMVCGKTVFDKIKFNCFDSAKSIEYIYGPRTDAFSEFDALLNKALSTDSSKPIFLILGQTATALAYALCKRGRQAIDIGHLAKDYNSWKLNEAINNSSIRNFYDKD